MAITRSGIVRKAQLYMVDLTSNFFTSERTNNMFKKILDEVTKELDIPNLRKVNGLYGASSTTFDITNTTGTTFRYTYDTGRDPNFSTEGLAVSDSIIISADDFNSNNNGTFTVTAVDDAYFEVTNANGVVESDKGIKTGYIVNGNIRTVANQEDYPMPSDFQKFGISTIISVGSYKYRPIFEDESGEESRHSRNSIWIEGDRFYFDPIPPTNENIIIPYYKVHPAVTDSGNLSLPDEAENSMVQGVLYEMMKLDFSTSSQESQLQFRDYQSAKTKLKSFLLTRRLKGRRQVFTDSPSMDLFDVS